jgi:palmitoyltransferase
MANLPDTECNILSPALCSYVYADSYTLVLVAWTALQLTWVTMLLVVQFVQVSRALTTYESMHGAHHVHGSKASEAITMALTTGTSSLDAAQLGPRNRGPDPAASHAHHAHQHRSWLGQWKKLLGIDSFMETALHKDKRRSVKKRNPFSRGCLQNCKDFWCDSSPLFGHRESGIALLNGQPVNYTMMYEPPSQFSVRSRPTEAAHREYEQVSQEEDIV